MYRKDLIDLLLHNPMSLAALSKLLETPPRDVEDDLRHLLKTLKHTEYRLEIEPATCRKCGFEFDKEKVRKPSKCPQCHSTWVEYPLIRIEKQDCSR